jgi:hypothetical protein
MEPSSRESITRQISRIPVDIARDGLPREERFVIEVTFVTRRATSLPSPA